MADETSTHIGGNVSVTGGGDFVGRDKVTNVYQSSPAPTELTQEQLAAAETRYRAQVAERYNRLGFAGLGIISSDLSELPLDDVFVRLTLTVEKIVREPIPPEEWAQEREEPRRNPFRRGEKREDERPRERIVTVQEPITLGSALAQHALIVGEPGAGKSTLLRWLAVTFAGGSQRDGDRLGPQADADRLPLLVELGRLPEAYLQANSRETPNWKVFLPAHLTKQPPFDDIPAAFLEQALAQGHCLLLCDGLDEIADLSARRRLADSLAEYARSSANRLVLSSRPAGVSGSEASLGARFQRLTIQRLAPEDVRRFFGFLCAQYAELTAQEKAKEADALYAAVQAAPKTLELATTPLLATLLLLLWNQDGYLPERRVELYERCCRMLIESWEAQHDVAYTGVLAEIGWERHLRLLAPLAYAIHNTGQRTDAPASELIPVLAQAMQAEGLTTPAFATLEAEKFLRTLSLRSGLLQFLGTGENSQGRYGFPHLTFQEYLTARHIAAQPDLDYIDLVMVHLHKAWWREVHLLVIGHLGSGREGANKASWLLLRVLDFYPPPWRLLRSMRFNLWSALAVRVHWQWEWRLAWVLEREFILAASGFAGCAPLGINTELRRSLVDQALRTLLQVGLDPGRQEEGIGGPLDVTTSSLRSLGEMSEDVVSALVVALKNSEWRVRQAAVNSLGSLGKVSEAVVPALIEALGDSSTRVRQAAASNLGSLGEMSEEVRSALVAALIDSDYDVRRAAISSLRSLGKVSETEVSPFVAALDHSSERVREAVAKSLGLLGQVSKNEILALLVALGDSEWRVREAATISLGSLGKVLEEDIVSELVKVLVDPSEHVREAAAKSLGLLREISKNEVLALVAALDDSEWCVREAAASSLVSLGQVVSISSGYVSKDVVSALARALDHSSKRVRQAAASSLASLDEAVSAGSEEMLGKVVSVLMAALGDSEWRVRQAAAKSLGLLGETGLIESGQMLEEVVSALRATLVATLGDPSFSRRAAQAAASSLVSLGRVSEEVVAALVAALDHPFDYDVRQAAAKSLVSLGESSVLVAALDHSEGHVRQTAASSLGSLGVVSMDVVSALVAALGDVEYDVRQAVANSLVSLGQTSALAEVLGDLDYFERLLVVSTLGGLSEISVEVVSALVEALGDSEWRVRQAAASSLGELGDSLAEVVADITTALVGVLGDSSGQVRQAAASSLGQLKLEDEDQLRRVLVALNRRLHDREDYVRRAALTAIRRLLDGRQIPGYRWVPLQERREKARKRQILGKWILGISVGVLVAWVAAGLTTYLSLDEFWVRFVGALAALVALAAGAVQVLGWFRRPPWNR